MAALSSVEIFLEFEPIVKLVCENLDCRFNLANDANVPERKEAACNLKQIIIGQLGICKNFEPIKK